MRLSSRVGTTQVYNIFIQLLFGGIQSFNNSTLVTGKVGCLVGMSERIVGCLGGSVLKVDITGVVKKNRVTSGFGFKVIIGVSLCVSGPYTLQLSCGT